MRKAFWNPKLSLTLGGKNFTCPLTEGLAIFSKADRYIKYSAVHYPH